MTNKVYTLQNLLSLALGLTFWSSIFVFSDLIFHNDNPVPSWFIGYVILTGVIFVLWLLKIIISKQTKPEKFQEILILLACAVTANIIAATIFDPRLGFIIFAQIPKLFGFAH